MERPIVFFDGDTEEEIIPGRYPMSIKHQFLAIFGREPDPYNSTDIILVTLLDYDGTASLSPYEIANELDINIKNVPNYIRAARQMLKTRNAAFKIVNESKNGWSIEVQEIPTGAETPNCQQNVSAPKSRFDCLGEEAKELLRKMENQNITLTYSQKVIVGTFADAGLGVPLTYEQVAEKSGYALNTVKSLLSSLPNMSPWAIAGNFGQPKYLHKYSNE